MEEQRDGPEPCGPKRDIDVCRKTCGFAADVALSWVSACPGGESVLSPVLTSSIRVAGSVHNMSVRASRSRGDGLGSGPDARIAGIGTRAGRAAAPRSAAEGPGGQSTARPAARPAPPARYAPLKDGGTGASRVERTLTGDRQARPRVPGLARLVPGIALVLLGGSRESARAPDRDGDGGGSLQAQGVETLYVSGEESAAAGADAGAERLGPAALKPRCWPESSLEVVLGNDRSGGRRIPRSIRDPTMHEFRWAVAPGPGRARSGGPANALAQAGSSPAQAADPGRPRLEWQPGGAEAAEHPVDCVLRGGGRRRNG